SPDLILLDIAMPKMDGIAVCRALRSDPRNADTIVLFYTASPSGEREVEMADLDASGVLVKPVDPHLVATEVRKLIGPPTG
ncbi:MAG TPA: response regulator, partial [Longimicrobiaceae bacterium]|nr:response regulator [Longimicrobiaceae bacterium]